MTGFLIFYAVALWLANIVFCGMLAHHKNQSIIGWCFLGALFPGIALIAIAGVWKGKEEENTTPKPYRNISDFG